MDAYADMEPKAYAVPRLQLVLSSFGTETEWNAHDRKNGPAMSHQLELHRPWVPAGPKRLDRQA